MEDHKSQQLRFEQDWNFVFEFEKVKKVQRRKGDTLKKIKEVFPVEKKDEKKGTDEGQWKGCTTVKQ